MVNGFTIDRVVKDNEMFWEVVDMRADYLAKSHKNLLNRDEAQEAACREIVDMTLDPKHRIYAIIKEDEVVGYCLGTSNVKGLAPVEVNNGYTITDIYMKREYRGKGLSRNALNLLCSDVVLDEFDQIMARIPWKNERGREFFKNFGFEVIYIELSQGAVPKPIASIVSLNTY